MVKTRKGDLFGCCLVIFSLATTLGGCRKSAGPPYTAAEELKTFKMAPGYKIQTFATEPDIDSPVAIDFDENGNVYVVEDRGYPLDIKGKVGRVKMLHLNEKGVPDKVTIFADHLTLPTGVMRWKKGILVTDAPYLWYFEDTDGDGKADIKRQVLTGFPFTNPQHTVNTPLYGLDNWIYLAHEGPATAVIYKKEFGDRGAPIHYVDRSGGPVLNAQRNTRLRPDTGELETLSSTSQYGQSFDDYGRHFLVSNSNHVRMEAIAERYLDRNPDLPIQTAIEDIPDHGADAKVFPITLHPRFEMLSGVGEFTSACGIVYYRGSTFTAEPVHNIVHQDQLVWNGSLYLAKRAQNNSEFLASTDSWFRPVFMTIGPDGAMYVVDYYRMIIEHPEWMATDQQHSPDLYKGQSFGRIYRIVPDTGATSLTPARLGTENNQQLVQELANPVAWWRTNAQRLLIDRNAVDAVPALTTLFEQSASPQARVHALWTLEGLHRLPGDLIRRGLTDSEPGVRENAIVLAEQHMRAEPDLQKVLLSLSNDPVLRVRYQLVQTLGFLKTPASQEVRDQMLFKDVEDKWFQLAALSASSDDSPRLFAKAIQWKGAATPGRTSLFRYTASVIAARQKPHEVERVLSDISAAKGEEQAWWRTATLDGLNQGLHAKHGNLSVPAKLSLVALFESGEPSVRRSSLRILDLVGLPTAPSTASALRRAAASAQDSKANPDLRADSVGLLALSDPELHADLFKSLIDPHQPEVVQAAAVRAYGRLPGDEVGTFLLADWRNFTSEVRSEAADAMLLQPSRQKLLVSALQGGDVQPWSLTFRQKIRLIMNVDPVIRSAVRPLLAQTPKEREAVVKRYQAALDMKGDVADGKEIFHSICSRCHRLSGGPGHDVGPDLGTVRNQPKQVLLTDILIPSLSIAQGYESYVVDTNSGGNYDGVIGAQTPTTITLKHEDGKEDVIQRPDIKDMYATNLSAMPGDLDKQISVKQMAGLLEFLKTSR